MGLRDQAQLSQFEALSAAIRSEEPLPAGRLTPSHYRAIHRHLFQDVYPWAGRYRTVRMTKDQSPFCFPENIAAEMRALFERLAAADVLRGRDTEGFADGAAGFLAYLNAIHPFREGNGRTQLTFLSLLSVTAGHPFDLSRLDPPAFLQAMVASFFGNEAPLRAHLHNLIAD